MSQSGIAPSLRGGVEGKLGVGSAAARAGISKELTFVDPEQRTIPLGHLRPTEECKVHIEAAATIRDPSEAVLVHGVLVAIVKNSVCKKVEASGNFATIAGSEATAYSDCV
jgi:hypothetical protein